MKIQTRNNLFKLSGLLALALLLVTTSAHATPPIGGPNAAHDQADAAAYASWDNGDNDGFGFGAWTLATSGVNAGHFMGAATGNGDGDTNTDGDIDTGGESWGLWANSGDTAEAVRTFSSALAIGDTFQIDMDNGWIDNTNTVGFGLRNSANENLFEFYFVGGEASYTINDASGPTFTGIGFTDEGLHILFTLTGSDTYRVIVTLVETGVSQTFWGSLMNPAGGQSVAEARLFNANAGNGGTNNAFFNNLHIGTTTTEFVASDIATTADLARSVFAADLDNDGDLDVLSASENDDTIAWYENDGAANPTFTTRVIVTTADGAQTVFAADLDNDGDLDVLSGSTLDDTITWYENDGAADPTFTARVITTTADGAYGVYAADLDNDGDLDVLTASLYDNTIAWYENDGAANPSFTARVITTAALGARWVFAADLDNDGDLDVLSASRADDTIAWYENDGAADPSFTAHAITTTADGAYGVYAADLDNDGDLDILSASDNDDTIAWYENDGAADPSFTAHDITTAANGAYGVYAADLDNDGDLDVLSASYADGTIAWYQNDGAADPTFTASAITAAADGAFSVYAADLDNDGDLDALSASGADDTIAWYENDLVHRNAPFAANSYNVGTSLYDVFSTALGDLDNDGDLDAVAGSFTGTVANVLVAYQNNGTPFSSGAWTQNDIGSTAHGVSQVLLGDLDNDGDLDIVTGSYTREDYEIIVWQNDGTPFGGLWTPNDVGTTTPDAGVWSVALGDLDNDGDLDIVSSSYFSEDYEITAWSNDGTPFSGLWTPNDVGASTQSVDALAIGDLDEDGWLDIVSGNQAGEITAWSNDGTPFSGLWTSNSVGNSISPVKFAALGDLDNNGTLDIVSGSDSGEDYEVIAWSNDGTPFSGAWTQNDAGASVDSVQAVALGDLDNDGDLDIVSNSLAREDYEVIIWDNDGTPFSGLWTQNDVGASTDGGYTVSIGDLDQDGDLDLISGGADNNVRGWQNQGGSAGFTVTDTSVSSPVYIPDSTEDDVMQVVFTHNGIAADRDLELNYWNLDLFRGDCSTPLTSAEANAFIDNLRIRLDDGDGTFETDGSDALVSGGDISTLSLTGGVQTISFANDDANVTVDQDVTPTRTYWVSILTTATASDVQPNNVCVNLDPDADMLVEGKTPDFSVSIQDSEAVNTGDVPTAVTLQSISATNQVGWVSLLVGLLALAMAALRRPR
ncbi:MAG: VCBS repeat-containing protein [Ardenticatenaceae bacterium]|nr:VCBS repeat-containing protein [Ardenticatenaceae bacterium]